MRPNPTPPRQGAKERVPAVEVWMSVVLGLVTGCVVVLWLMGGLL